MSSEVERPSPRRSGYRAGEAATDEAAAVAAGAHLQNQHNSAMNLRRGRYEEEAMAAAADHISTRLNDSLYVSDDEGAGSSSRSARRRPFGPVTRSSPLHVRSLSFSVGTTPGKQYPTRFVQQPKLAAVLCCDIFFLFFQ